MTKNRLLLTYNPALDKYENIVLFEEKIEKAKVTLARVGIPEKWRIQLEVK